MRRRLLALSLFAISSPALVGGCSSAVLAPSLRTVDPDEVAAEDWTPAEGVTLQGLYASTRIEGELALSLIQVYYLFGTDGSFTAAALVATEPPSFQVLSGRWTLEGSTLTLGDGTPPARLDRAADSLRISGPEGSVILRAEP